MILYPQYRFETYWNTIVILFTSYIGFWIPIHIVFSYEITPSPIFRIMNGLSYIVFLLDIIFTIKSTTRKGTQSYIRDHFSLRKYMLSWFIVDLIGIIPLEWIGNDPEFAIFRLVKLGVVTKIMYESYQREVRFSYLHIFGFFTFLVGISAHGLSCGWIALTKPALVASEEVISIYIQSLYWVVTTLTTVGYGDIVPKGNAQIIYTMFVQILGVALYSYVIGNVAGILSKNDPARAKYLENIDKLSAMVQYRRMPFELQRKIRDYYFFMWKKRIGYDESIFLQGLPYHLQSEVATYLKKDVVDKIHLFKGASKNFIREIAFHLEPMILMPGDYICRKGEKGSEMYFLLKGRLSVYVNNEKEYVRTLEDGDFFGEIALFNNIHRTASVKAETFCDLYRLDKSGFDMVLQRYPQFAKKIEKQANRLNTTDSD